MTEEDLTGFKRKHYRVLSGPCWDALKAYRDIRTEVGEEHLAWARSVGGVGCYSGSTENVGNGVSIYAVVFEGELPKGWKRRDQRDYKGLKPGQTAAWPDKRSSEGKAATVAINALRLLPDPDRVTKAIGFPHSLEYEKEGQNGFEALGFFETIRIGWLLDTFYVSLPDIAGQRARRIADGYTVTTPEWHPLEGMEPILKEEMALDFARHREMQQAA
jgi:hypothetical protein